MARFACTAMFGLRPTCMAGLQVCWLAMGGVSITEVVEAWVCSGAGFSGRILVDDVAQARPQAASAWRWEWLQTACPT